MRAWSVVAHSFGVKGVPYSAKPDIAFTRALAFAPQVRLTQNRPYGVPVTPWDIYQEVPLGGFPDKGDIGRNL
jgi:hypothetical protein